jgi:exonuclease III
MGSASTICLLSPLLLRTGWYSLAAWTRTIAAREKASDHAPVWVELD